MSGVAGGIEVCGLSFAYGANPALREVSFSVRPGRFAALLGPNGAGKSTLFALLTRLFSAPTGEIRIDGIDISRRPTDALAKIGVVFQQPTLDLDLTVERNLSYFAALHGLSGAEARHRIDAALARLDMGERAGERVRALNGGHRRRVEIARALIHRPAFLLLDEPTVGLDVAARSSVTAHVHALARDGLAVLWATHLTDEIAPDDQVILLHRGEIRANGTAASLAGGRSLEETFLAMTGAGP